ncbi:MAG: 50S ribosomal protein L11 methyltransferase [Pseudorhodoplanes sp.]
MNSGDAKPDLTQAAFWARLACDAAGAPALAERLAELLDPDTVAVSTYEQAAGWQIEIAFATPPDPDAFRSWIREFAGADLARTLTFGHVAARDWVAASLQGLAPVEAGRFVVHGAHDRTRIPPQAIGIEIEAALAFGTGHHGTTRGCLLAFDRLLKRTRPRRILDIGTGSGVLAIAAARALRKRVTASDIDPLAVRAARGNARLNRAGSWVQVRHAAGLIDARLRAHAPYDLIFANILLAPLRRLSAPIAALLAPGGTVILSGLLEADAPAALEAYRAQGLALVQRIGLQGWVTLSLH